MKQHTWVSMQYTPIEATPMPDGTLKIEATEAAIELSVEDALMGCWFCHIPLSVESFDTPCTPDSNLEK